MGACGEDGGEGEEIDAADAEDGDRWVGVDGADVERADGMVIGFGGGGEERAEADAVGSFCEGGVGLGETVGGFADEDARACELAGFCDGEIVLADVGAFDAGGAGGFRVVIDDEGDAGGFGERVEGAGGGDDIVRGPAFGAELDDVDPTGDHGGEHGGHLISRGVGGVEDSVEAAVGERSHGGALSRGRLGATGIGWYWEGRQRVARAAAMMERMVARAARMKAEERRRFIQRTRMRPERETRMRRMAETSMTTDHDLGVSRPLWRSLRRATRPMEEVVIS